jgi:UDP-N-acetylmuramate dehydrogenase
MEFLENYPLQPLTSFKIGGPAKFFCAPATPVEITEALAFAADKDLRTFILGGGSNVVISDDGLDALVINPSKRGMKVIEETDKEVLIEVCAGENWDEFVQYAIGNNWWGIENLSYVPGSAGAFAVQNVGAYGQEASDVVASVEAYDVKSGKVVNLSNKECGFYYRHSIFNTIQKGQYIILSTTLRLGKNGKPNLSYPDLVKRFGDSTPTLPQIREAIIEIRNRKYPFPRTAEGGSVGSFFQNPILNDEQVSKLRGRIREEFGSDASQKFAELEEKFSSKKIGLKASAFLIDICGLKGAEVGGVKVNENQPLVLLNKGNGTSRDVLEIAQKVRSVVYARTGVVIPIEPELVGFSKADFDEFLTMPAPH